MIRTDLVQNEVVEEKKTYLPLNLQLFASSSTGDNGGDGDAEDSDLGEDADDDVEDVSDADDSTDDKKGDKKKEKTFTQSQVNKMMAREKRQGKKSALKELGADGMTKEDIAEAPQFASVDIAEFKKWKESQKTDAQKAAEKEALAKAEKEEFSERTRRAEVKAESLSAGVKSKYVDDVIVLAIAAMNADDDLDAEAAVEEVKKKHKSLFVPESKKDDDTDEEDGKNKSGSRGTGSVGREDGNKNNKKSMGARLAASKKSSKNSSKLASRFFN